MQTLTTTITTLVCRVATESLNIKQREIGQTLIFLHC